MPSYPSAVVCVNVSAVGEPFPFYLPSYSDVPLTAICCRFAELESMVAITMILQKYKITVKEDPKFAGETFEQKKERVLETKEGLTLT